MFGIRNGCVFVRLLSFGWVSLVIIKCRSKEGLFDFMR